MAGDSSFLSRPLLLISPLLSISCSFPNLTMDKKSSSKGEEERLSRRSPWSERGRRHEPRRRDCSESSRSSSSSLSRHKHRKKHSSRDRHKEKKRRRTYSSSSDSSSTESRRKRKDKKKHKRRSKSKKSKHSHDKKKPHKKDRKRSKQYSDDSSSSSGEDGPNVKRSVITGKKIKMHIDKDDDDLVREKARKDLLKFMNQSL